MLNKTKFSSRYVILIFSIFTFSLISLILGGPLTKCKIEVSLDIHALKNCSQEPMVHTTNFKLQIRHSRFIL
jgi:hypothetical protein